MAPRPEVLSIQRPLPGRHGSQVSPVAGLRKFGNPAGTISSHITVTLLVSMGSSTILVDIVGSSLLQ
jgi:hypothetical protein